MGDLLKLVGFVAVVAIIYNMFPDSFFMKALLIFGFIFALAVANK